MKPGNPHALPSGWKKGGVQKEWNKGSSPSEEIGVERCGEFLVGERVPGTKWVVKGLLGRGGMGVVLDVVKEPGIGGALKVMHPELALNGVFAARFLEEARLLAKVQHPNIVKIIDSDRLADGRPFFVMERIEGRTLRQAMRELRDRGVVLGGSVIWEVVSQVGDALHALHSQRPGPVVHRDVKPENVRIRRVPGRAQIGEAKLLDFGLVLDLGTGRRVSSKHLVGTPRYMAPEQLDDRYGAISPKADLYALALVTYEMVTSRFPWDVNVRDVAAMIEAHLTRSPQRASTFCQWVPPAVDEALARALAKNPAERQTSVAQFLENCRELETVKDGSSYADVDIYTTAPSMATLASLELEKPHESHDTVEGMSVPPVEGPSLETTKPLWEGAGDKEGQEGGPDGSRMGGPPGEGLPEEACAAQERADGEASPVGPSGMALGVSVDRNAGKHPECHGPAAAALVGEPVPEVARAPGRRRGLVAIAVSGALCVAVGVAVLWRVAAQPQVAPATQASRVPEVAIVGAAAETARSAREPSAPEASAVASAQPPPIDVEALFKASAPALVSKPKRPVPKRVPTAPTAAKDIASAGPEPDDGRELFAEPGASAAGASQPMPPVGHEKARVR
jgi:serine/threonine protein kinase